MSNYRIIKMTAENIKRLKAVSISPTGKMVEITGRNAQGKSSVLDSIMYALAGRSSIPSRPIRDGETSARVQLDIGGEAVEIVVELRMTEKGEYLEVRSPDGARFPKAQAKLNDLVGALSFDPLAFTRMKPAEQSETLRSLAGLDFAAMDAERKTLYDQRRDWNRDAKAVESQVAGIPAARPDLPDVPVSVSALAAELQRINEHNTQGKSMATHVTIMARRVADSNDRVATLREQLAEAERALDSAKVAHTKAQNELASFTAIDPQSVQNQIANAESTNDAIRKRDARAELVRRAAELNAKADAATAEMERIDRTKAEMLANARLPIDGLSLTDDAVTYNGIPMEQCSSAEQLKVSVAMAIALNPKLRVMLVRDGSLLDDDSLKVLGEMAEQHDAQVWIECVSHGEARGFVIEDGQLKA